MRLTRILTLLAAAALAAGLAAWGLRQGSRAPEPEQPVAPEETPEPPRPAVAPEHSALARPKPPAPGESFVPAAPEPAQASVSKTDYLAQLRETFRALAGGDPRTALRAARQLTNDVERETALLALVTEWKQGDLSPPRQRAWAIASLGLEAGLAAELADKPELAQLWASELTNHQGHAVAPDRLAPAMVDADPAVAFAFGQQLSPDERRKFYNAAFTSWAQTDTTMALQAAEQLSDPAEREAALKSIRSVAPVGIGVELTMREGYPVINRMLPGAPAELSGQLHPGDRIVGFSQGYNTFVDVRSLPLPELVQAIRGAPGTVLQLQVLPADAPPNSLPRTISLTRDQIKHKR
jgi:hypothetical protein